MRKHRITDAEADAIVAGRIPDTRSDLEVVARALTAYRTAADRSEPALSAALRVRLDVLAGSSASRVDAAPSEGAASTSRRVGAAARARTGGGRRMGIGIAGVGVAVKVFLGSAVVVGATAGAAMAAGAAGVLPPTMQSNFEEVVSVIATTTEELIEGEPIDEMPLPEPTPSASDGEFGAWVSELAQNKPGTGAEFGEMVSEQAKLNGRGGNPHAEDPDDETDTSDGPPSNPGSNGNGPGNSNRP